MIRLSPSTSNRSIAEIEGTKSGLWKTTYTFLVSETKERFCHCVTLVHDAYSFENAMKARRPTTSTTMICSSSIVRNHLDSAIVNITQSSNYLYSKPTSSSSTAARSVVCLRVVPSSIRSDTASATPPCSSNEDGEIYMVQLVLPIPDQFLINEKHDLIDIVKNLPLGKVVDPMHMTHAMKIIESEGWLIEQEKAD